MGVITERVRMLRLGTSVQDDIVVFGAVQVTTSTRCIHGLLDLAHRLCLKFVEPPKRCPTGIDRFEGVHEGGEDPKHRPKGVLELLQVAQAQLEIGNGDPPR